MDERPQVQEIAAAFRWPVFVKVARQTNRHQRYLSILESPTILSEPWMRARATISFDDSKWFAASSLSCDPLKP